MRRKAPAAVLASVLFLVLLSPVFAQEASPPSQPPGAPQVAPLEPAFTNADVVKLTQLGLGGEVIAMKVQTAKAVDFKLGTDDLIALKNAGVSQEVITAMLKRASSPAPSSAGGAPAPGAIMDTPMGAVAIPGMDDILVKLVTKDASTDLASVGGHMGTTYAFWTVFMFMDYPNLKADVRTNDRKPYILIQTRKSPQGRFFLVRCESNKDDNNRSVKMGKSGMYSSSGFGAPDSDWTVPFEVKQLQPGLWRMDPKENLKAGEYGVWGPSSELYDFGVDK